MSNRRTEVRHVIDTNVIDSFWFALCAELKDTGVTVTCLMPGAAETDFFERVGMLDTGAAKGSR